MKLSLISFFLLVQLQFLNAQGAYYDLVNLGEYQINYSDTIIYDHEIQYNQYGYAGDAPLFVQLWFPSAKISNNKRLDFGEFKSQNVPKELLLIYEKLTDRMDEILIRDGIEYNIMTDEPIDYGKYSLKEIQQKIELLLSRSIRSSFDSVLNYPVIVYHHGSQGLSYENSIMAEFFASNGYIFISANFHLPYENTLYGLLPYDLEKESKHNQSSARALISFAKSITSQGTVFYIGHSWGAQEGWCFLHDATLVDAFVSLETTIEYKKDTSKIKELWPYVYDALKVKKNTFAIPILALAADDQSLDFNFFHGLSSKEMIFAAYKEPFAHNSYTSTYMMRYFLGTEINQPDSEILRSQIEGYNLHLKMIYAFFETIQKKQVLKRNEFDQYFNFH